MRRDGVAAALDLILDELSVAYRQLSDEVSDALAEKRTDSAGQLIDTAKRLDAFRTRLEGLKREWTSELDATTRERVLSEPPTGDEPREAQTFDDDAGTTAANARTKAAKTVLKVRLPSGRVIHRRIAADTFVETIRELGVENVRALNLTLNKTELVSNALSEKYSGSQRALGDYFVITHSGTKTKKEQLDEISRRLDAGLIVEIV